MTAPCPDVSILNDPDPIELSIVIPVFNAESTLQQLLASLEQLRSASVEVICIDDGSTDGSADAVRSFSWVIFERRPRRGGAGACRNTGASLARGEWLLFLDADTRVRDAHLLEKVSNFIKHNTEYQAFSGCYHDSNANPGRFARFLDSYEHAIRSESQNNETWGAFSGALGGIRRDVFEALGGFDEDRKVALEDEDLGCRLSANGYRHWFSGELQIEHWQPEFKHYCQELVPRTRHYMHLLDVYGAFNEIMGGTGEGVARALGLLFILCVLVTGVWPEYGSWLLALSLMLYLWVRRPLWRQVLKEHGLGSIALAAGFDLATSLAIAAGGALGAYDFLGRYLGGKKADIAVFWCYLKSLVRKDSPGYLIFFLTHRCNAMCGHCFDDAQRQRIHRDEELTIEEIEIFARDLGVVGHLSLTGGEPFLRTDLSQIVEVFYRFAGVRSFSISTNGSMPERVAEYLPKILAAAPNARIIVTLSYDGLGREHDRLRRLPGLYAQTERSFDVLARLRQWHSRLHIHGCMTLTDQNQATILTTLDYLESRGFDEIELNLLRGAPANPTVKPVSVEQYQQVMDAVKSANQKGRSGFGLTWLFKRIDRLMFDIVHRSDRPWACGDCVAGRKLHVVRANGEVLPCEVLHAVRPALEVQYQGFVMGGLRENQGRLREVMSSPNAKRLIQMIGDSRCHCSFECAIMATLVYRPWRLPKLLWQSFRESRSPG